MRRLFQKIKNPLRGVAALQFFSVWIAIAQEIPAPTQNKPLGKDEGVVELSPFLVVGDSNDSYEAHNTAGVTGTNRAIRNLPISMNVATSAFLGEINARNLLDAIQLMPNIALTTPDANNGGTGSQADFRLRGFTSKEERRRNGVLSLGVAEPFSVDRIEFLRGAQALLYGQGISSGAINVVTKRATFGRTFGELSAQTDSDGSFRFTLDENLALAKLAVRVAAVDANKEFWQDNQYDKTQGLYVDLAFLLSKNLVARVNHEYIEGHATYRGNTLTIRDNSLQDTRNNIPLDRILFNGGNVSDIILGGAAASYDNYRSLAGVTTGRDSISRITNVSIEGRFGKLLSANLSYSTEVMRFYNEVNGLADLLSPNDNRAINKQWSYTVDPTRSDVLWNIDTLRGTLIYKLELGNVLKSEFVVGAEDRFKKQGIDRQRLYAVDVNGKLLPGTDALGMKQFATYVIPVSGGYASPVRDVPGYTWANTHTYGVVPPTALNPRGLGGVGTPLLSKQEQQSVFATWLGTWLDGRIDSMAGARFDNIKQTDEVLANVDYDDGRTSGLIGAVYNFSPSLGVYANAGRSFSAVAATKLQVYDYSDWPAASGKSLEAGVKFDAFAGRASGTLAFYSNKNHGELAGASNAQLDLFNPAGINGRYTGIGVAAPMYAETKGVEIAVTLKPTKEWRILFSAATNDAHTIASSFANILYNDQFNTDGTTVKIKNADGSFTDLLVPSIRTDPNSPKIPLSIAMMKNSASDYFAQIDPISGRIVNANNLFLNTAGVRTGISGLPISQHQLGFQPANNGSVEVIKPGDYLAPVPGRSLLLNTTYTFSRGTLAGCSVGGLVSWQGQMRMGYTVLGGIRQLYYAPDSYRIDLRVGYHWQLKNKMNLSFQLTASNVTDKQTLLPTYNALDGTLLTAATIAQAPRTFVLSSTLRF